MAQVIGFLVIVLALIGLAVYLTVLELRWAHQQELKSPWQKESAEAQRRSLNQLMESQQDFE